jgi:hypothetical protein
MILRFRSILQYPINTYSLFSNFLLAIANCKLFVQINDRLYESLMTGEVPDVKSLLGQEDIILLKRRAQTLTSNKSLPPVVTHNMVDGDKDGMLVAFFVS